MKIIPEIGRTH